MPRRFREGGQEADSAAREDGAQMMSAASATHSCLYGRGEGAASDTRSLNASDAVAHWGAPGVKDAICVVGM
eukprot:4946495-Prymnesium_polylepis.1